MGKGYNIDDNHHAFVITDSTEVADFFKERHPKIGIEYVGEGEDKWSSIEDQNITSFKDEFKKGYGDGYFIGKMKRIAIFGIPATIIGAGLSYLVSKKVSDLIERHKEKVALKNREKFKLVK